MLYFAYGSNMNWQQMRERCPSMRFVGIALLPDHKLAFTRESINRGCGVADAVREQGQEIWGVVYDIDDLDVANLDRSEGFKPGRPKNKNSYCRRNCLVLLDGDRRRQLTASSYFGVPRTDPPLPNNEYMQLIISGARHWRLPADYVRALEAIQAKG